MPMLFLLIVLSSTGPAQRVEIRTEALCIKAQAILLTAQPPMYSICVANDKNGKN